MIPGFTYHVNFLGFDEERTLIEAIRSNEEGRWRRRTALSKRWVVDYGFDYNAITMLRNTH